MSCGVQGALRLADAQRQLAAMLTCCVGRETVPLAQALGRVLAEVGIARYPSPRFDNSAMDGFALQAADLAATGPLPVAGTALAGHPFAGPWPSGSVVRIMTGAPVPQGTAAVVMQEQTETVAQGESAAIVLRAAVQQGQNIRRCGEDIAAGEPVLAAGVRLGARYLPLLAAVGVSQVVVYRPLRVACFSSGDELGDVDAVLLPGQLVDSNRYGLRALLHKLGCDVLDLGIIPDDPAALREAFLRADAEADVLITSGGVSVGEADYTRQILAELGEVAFWKVAIKPGKPFACGRLSRARHGRWFFGLPGNPVSALVTFLLLVQPALLQLMGAQPTPRLSLRATSREPLRLSAGRIDFQRGMASVNAEGELEVALAGEQGSGMFRALAQANCLICLDDQAYPGVSRLPAGSRVEILLFDEVMA